MQPDPEYIKAWQANLHAYRLRKRKLSYTAIAVVMDELYGIDRSPEKWRLQLRSQGIGPSKGPNKVAA